MSRVGIQGVRAAFHDVAARKYFKDKPITLVECATFKTLSLNLDNRVADICLMAIENSIAGSILPNYSLLEVHGFKIIGEVYLRIEMNLMALPGQTLQDIKVVQSHPMALLQCEDFFAAHPHLKIVEHADTAESAKEIREKNLKEYASIASQLAADVYGLQILAAGIESNKSNYTRFLVICRQEDYVTPTNANKASIRFEVKDRAGALASVLRVFNEQSINMTKIQSVPILGRPYEYSFHVDLEWEDINNYRKALHEMTSEVVNLIHFGEYSRGERPNS